MPDLETFIRAMPKVELHLHIEGTLEPELMFALAERNNVELPWTDVEEARTAYNFSDLQSFLDLYYASMQVLCTRQDFYDLTRAYLDQAISDNVMHAELMFDPQAHTARGVPFDDVIEGIWSAMRDVRKQITTRLILSFLRHLPPEDAMETLRNGLRHRDRLTAVGLDSSEVGFPPELFADVFAVAREAGLRTVAHAGEEGPPAYVTGALKSLKAERIDHGIRSLEDPDLVAVLSQDRVPLTVCPLSNVALGAFASMSEHNLRHMMAAGLLCTVNSDDPAYFGGYLSDNFAAAATALGLDRNDIMQLVRNSVEGAFMTDKTRTKILAELAAVADQFPDV